METRVCKKCDLEQPIENFSEYLKGKYRRHECRGCVSKRQLVCYEKKKEERIQKMTEYNKTYTPPSEKRVYRNWNGRRERG